MNHSKIENRKSKINKVILLGIDGLDPNILERLMEAKGLPNFSLLRARGDYRPLITSNPAQSPVAWSTIATGSNPAYHSIFDFIIRDPEDYLPSLSIMKTNPRNLLARRGLMFLPTRKGTPFWSITSRANIPTTVIKWPVTLPPDNISGRMLSGLGVPDLKTNLGWYSFYTTRVIPEREKKERKGDIIHIEANDHTIETVISGPNKSHLPLKIRIEDKDSRIIIDIEGKEIILPEGEWSDWIQVRFNIGLFRYISALCRFYLKSIRPELELYLSPIQVDPSDPAFLISYPDEYAPELARDIGNYSTLGMPEDTNALNDNCFNEEAFLKMCDTIMVEREKMLLHELARFKEGVLAFVFDTTDRIQHIFWSTRDPEHPIYEEGFAKRYQDVIKDYYIRMDKILGKVLDLVDQRTIIIILSDHGFTSFRRGVHLNSWLVENGLMVLDRSRGDGEDGLFKNVVWERTKAYALGFSSIYINLRDREGKGIVRPGDEADALKRKIREALIRLKDPRTDRPVIKDVYLREDIYRGPFIDKAPDLIIGFHPGYRISWQTAVGGTIGKIFEDNLKKWSGDHLVDPYYVPGILLINQRISIPSPSLIDISPTILRCLEIPKPEDMEGDSLFS
ncbi:MAG: alkaline phosphatase family protein [Nitrospinae bacterium]|nr:alkaline phosphatase family protein [Nitrospinota bacterium]